jgi:hypothetical protein
MSALNSFRMACILAVGVIFFSNGCERDNGDLGPAKYPTTAEVFLDDFSAGMEYAAFGGSKVDAFDISVGEAYKSLRSIRIAVPNFDDVEGAYAGGSFYASSGRDLSGYDALTFYAKASQPATLDLVGYGNDVTNESNYIATSSGLAVNTNWRKYYIPIPNPSRLVGEGGLFFYSEGPENEKGFTIWFDEVQFERLGTIAHAKPAILENQDQTFTVEIGEALTIGGTYAIYNLPNAVDQRVDAAAGYFDYITASGSSDILSVNEFGQVLAVGVGTDTVTALLDGLVADGSMIVTVIEAAAAPTAAAPVPTEPAAEVISMFSNAYSDVAIDTWNTGWEFSTAQLNEVQIAGDDVKKYTRLNFVGIEFASQTIDATDKTHFHLDIWTPDPTAAPAAFKILLVDFGADGSFDGGDDSSHEITITAPTLQSEQWVGIDIPMSDFSGLSSRAHLAQLVLSGDPNTVYVDNVYFYGTGGGGGGSGPATAAPTPTQAAVDVVSLFSNAYSDVTVDTWSADWDDADVADVQIQGNDTKLYTNLAFAGIEFTSQTVDASAMTYLHLDVWTPDPTTAPAAFKIKLVDFGDDGSFEGGDDSEHEITLDNTTTPAMASEVWVGLDIPLADFSGLNGQAHLAQMIISGDPNRVYVDNIYFHRDGGGATPSEPDAAAPNPGYAAGDVISLFSGAYSNVTVDTWSADWDDADLEDVQINGNDTKKYTNLVFAGIEFTTTTIDANSMTHLSIDIWTPDATASPAVFKIKLVDFGADGAFEGGDDVEHELTLTADSTPAIATGSWVTLNIPLTEFTGLTTRGHLAQLIISGDPNTVYVDNVLFHK